MIQKSEGKKDWLWMIRSKKGKIGSLLLVTQVKSPFTKGGDPEPAEGSGDFTTFDMCTICPTTRISKPFPDILEITVHYPKFYSGKN